MLYRGYKKVPLIEEQNSAYDLLRHSLQSIVYYKDSLIECIFQNLMSYVLKRETDEDKAGYLSF